MPDRSPLDAPARILCAAQYRGIEPGAGMDYVVHIAPGVGELFDGPMNAVDGPRMAFNFEAVPGGPLESLVRRPYAQDPDGFNQAVMQALREHFPTVHQRLSPREFGVSGPLDILQGALRPFARACAAPGRRFPVGDGRSPSETPM